MRAIDRLMAAVDMAPQKRSVILPDGSEFEFYCTPLTAAERETAMKAAKDDAQKFGLTLLVNKAKDEAGAPLFAPGDMAQLRRMLPTSVVDELMAQILGAKEEGEEEAEEAPDMKSARSGPAKG